MHNISRCFFYIFFQVLIFGVISRAKEHKMAWNDKNYLCCNLYLSKHTSYDCAFCCTSLKWWHLQMFFHFFQILFFQVVRGGEGVKRAKNGPKWQKNLSNSISQKLYLIWLWFLVHIFKMLISLADFFIFWKVWFFRVFKIYQ